MPIIVLLLYILVSLLESGPLIKKRELKQLILFIGLLGSALVITELLLFKVDLPSPADPINDWASWIKKYLGG